MQLAHMDGSGGTMTSWCYYFPSAFTTIQFLQLSDRQRRVVSEHPLSPWLLTVCQFSLGLCEWRASCLMWWLVTEKHLGAPSCLCSCALYTSCLLQQFSDDSAVASFGTDGQEPEQRTARQFCGVALQKLFAFRSHCESLRSDWSRARILGDLRI